MYHSWGRKPVFHITNFMYTASRLLLLITYDNYLVSLLVVGLGSGFYPVGIRVAYIISRSNWVHWSTTYVRHNILYTISRIYWLGAHESACCRRTLLQLALSFTETCITAGKLEQQMKTLLLIQWKFHQKYESMCSLKCWERMTEADLRWLATFFYTQHRFET